MLAPPFLGELTPPPRGNPGSATTKYFSCYKRKLPARLFGDGLSVGLGEDGDVEERLRGPDRDVPLHAHLGAQSVHVLPSLVRLGTRAHAPLIQRLPCSKHINKLYIKSKCIKV